MKRAFYTFVTSSLIAGCLLLACGSDSSPGRGQLTTTDGDASALDPTDAGDAPPLDGRAPFDAAAPAIECAVTPCITRLVAGPTHYCATAKDGAVRCWGNPTPLGGFAASGDRGATPVVLTGIRDVVDVGAGALRTCVVAASGAVSCFGQDLPTPTRIDSVTSATKVAVGEDRSCAVEASGSLSCWGDSTATGKGTGAVSLGDQRAIAATMSAPAAFATSAKGTLFSWGSDAFMLGRDTALDVDWTPAPVEGIGPTLQVAASDRHVCALTTDGRLYCWGHDERGTLGLGSIRSVAIPTEVLFAGAAWPSQVAVSLTHSCVRMTDQSLACWARVNASGELGYLELTGVFIPTKVVLTKAVAAVAVGIGSTCVLSTDGSVQCWGDNAYGQLGLGRRDTERHPTPTTVVFP